MRLPALGLTAAIAALAFAAAASATNGQGAGHAAASCGVESPYALRIDPGGVRLDADEGDVSPQRVEIHDGVLRVDGVARPVTGDDAQRLREMETTAHALLPEIAGITRETIHITFDALGGVHAALNGDRRQRRAFERLRGQALERVALSLDRGVWTPEVFGEAFGAEIEAATEAIAADFTPGRAMWMVLTGGVGRMERRVERMEAELERSISAREHVFEAHATALCAGLETLDGLQQALDVRLDDGRPLQLFRFRADGDSGSGRTVWIRKDGRRSVSGR